MLRHINEKDAATRIQNAIEAIYREGKQTTRDIGGSATTAEFTDAVIAKLGRN